MNVQTCFKRHLLGVFTILLFLGISHEVYSMIDHKSIIEEKLNDWFNAHNEKNLDKLSSLYAQTLHYYGVSYSNAQCIADKKRMFAKNSSFNQNLVSPVQISQVAMDEYICYFTKRVSLNGSVKNYPSTVQFKNISGQWFITLENDQITGENKKKRKQGAIPKNAVLVDANGDGVDEYMWIVEPEIIDETECKGPCDSYVKFSNPSIPTLKIQGSIGGRIENLGDLNDDGGDEIGNYPDWFMLSWRSYRVWTLKNRSWIFPIPPFLVWLEHLESGRTMIRKDPLHKGYVIIRESDWDEESMPIVIEKSVKIEE